MQKSFGGIFSAGLALLLLMIYAVATLDMVLAIFNNCPKPETCSSAIADNYKPGYIYVVTTVSGLVSALVVAKLSVTSPGDLPSITGMNPESRLGRWANGVVVAVYLIVWVVVGLSCLIVGVMLYPDVITTVSDLGTAWLGLAVSSAYVYFGVDFASKSETAVAGRPTASDATLAALRQHSSSGMLTFSEPADLARLVGPNTKPALQNLLVYLSMTVPGVLTVESTSSDGTGGIARLDLSSGNDMKTLVEIARRDYADLGIDELIYDAAELGHDDRNLWNLSRGAPHVFEDEVLDHFKTHAQMSVL